MGAMAGCEDDSYTSTSDSQGSSYDGTNLTTLDHTGASSTVASGTDGDGIVDRDGIVSFYTDASGTHGAENVLSVPRVVHSPTPSAVLLGSIGLAMAARWLTKRKTA